MKGFSGIWNACRQVADANAAVFAADKTQNLIVRLQYNVIRAGLRRINLAYSRISLADVATRLGENNFSAQPCHRIPDLQRSAVAGDRKPNHSQAA